MKSGFELRTLMHRKMPSTLRRRPYLAEYTRSHLNSEVKLQRARQVPRRGTARENLRVLSAFCFKYHSLCFFESLLNAWNRKIQNDIKNKISAILFVFVIRSEPSSPAWPKPGSSRPNTAPLRESIGLTSLSGRRRFHLPHGLGRSSLLMRVGRGSHYRSDPVQVRSTSSMSAQRQRYDVSTSKARRAVIFFTIDRIIAFQLISV